MSNTSGSYREREGGDGSAAGRKLHTVFIHLCKRINVFICMLYISYMTYLRTLILKTTQIYVESY